MFANCRCFRWLLFAATAGHCVSWAPESHAQGYVGIDLYSPPAPATSLGSFGLGPGAAAGQVVESVVGGPNVNPRQFALLWTGPSGTVVDLTPPGLDAGALGTDGAHQVGWAGGHAYLWSGTAQSGIDLHPTSLGFSGSAAGGVHGNEQVGVGSDPTGAVQHALIWHGTAGSAVDIHPIALGFDQSDAIATDGVQQVGVGSSPSPTGRADHALLWTGTAASAVDLHPVQLPGMVTSIAYGVGGGQQVGYGSLAGVGQVALLWTGTAASAVILNPAAGTDSIAYGTNGVHQVGTVNRNSMGDHAFMWSGTAASAVDLNPLLPFNAVDSQAFSIDAQGNIFGVAFDGNNLHTVEWSLVPEPAAWAIFAAGTAALLAFRRRLSCR